MYPLSPFSAELNRVDIPKAELWEFFQRFTGALAERTTILTALIHTDEAFASWVPDKPPGSLETLGGWFMANVHTRPRTETEVFVEKSKSRFDFLVPPVTLTDRTFSLAADIGMYFAQVLMRLHPDLRWTLPLGSKTFADYGQPVLHGFRNGPTPKPLGVASTVAWRTSTGKGYPYELREALAVWSKHVETSSAPEDHEGHGGL